MANTDNQCKDLEVTNFHNRDLEMGECTLSNVYNHQKTMQESSFGFDFSSMTIGDIMRFWHANTHAVIDEIHEMTDALGGIEDGDGSAVWKYWKTAHSKYDSMTISDLSENDLKELKFEFVDILHFMLNYAISIGFTPNEMYNMYFAKAEENKNRQKNNY